MVNIVSLHGPVDTVRRHLTGCHGGGAAVECSCSQHGWAEFCPQVGTDSWNLSSDLHIHTMAHTRLHTHRHGTPYHTTRRRKSEWGLRGKGKLTHCWWEYKLVHPIRRAIFNHMTQRSSAPSVSRGDTSSVSNKNYHVYKNALHMVY